MPTCYTTPRLTLLQYISMALLGTQLGNLPNYRKHYRNVGDLSYMSHRGFTIYNVLEADA